MAIDFPSSPALNDTYTEAGKTWRWNGTGWQLIVTGTVTNADISATAEIAVSKLADGAARQVLQTDAAGTGVEWTSNVDIPGTLDVTGATTLDSTLSVPLGSAGSPSIYPGADTNTGIWSPAADTLAVSTGGSERLRVASDGKFLIGSNQARTNFFNSVSTTFVQLEGTEYQSSSAALICNSLDDEDGPTIVLAKSAGAALASNTLVSDNERLGEINFLGSDGSEFVEAARIMCRVDGTPGANDMPGRLVFSTTADGAASPTERMRITSAGLVGIGTTSPAVALDVSGSGNRQIRAITTDTSGANVAQLLATYTGGGGGTNTTAGLTAGDSYAVIGTSTNAPLLITTNNTERARIDSSGRLLVGTSTAPDYFAGSPGLSVAGTGNSSFIAAARYNSASTFGADLSLLRSRNGTVGSHTVVQNNDVLGVISFLGSDGSTFIPGARIFGEVDGTSGANDMPGRLVFSTTADGSSSPTEQMRITNAGELQFNSGYGSAAAAYGCRAWVNFNGTGTVAIRASGNVSSITDNGTGDYRVNFTTALADANYSVVASGAPTATPTTAQRWPAAVGTLSTGSVKILTPADGTTGNSLGDFALVNVAIFR